MADCIEPAHIYPYSLGTKVGQTGYSQFWRRLRYFWSAEQVKCWEEMMLGKERTEIMSNLMTLSPNVHALWCKAKFALKPLNLLDNKITLIIGFSWLPDSFNKSKMITTAPLNPPTLDFTSLGSRLFNCQTKECICSGDWILNRLVALAGAADVRDEDLNLDDPMGLAPPISVKGESEASSEEEEAEDEQEMEAPMARPEPGAGAGASERALGPKITHLSCKPETQTFTG
ncbi:hypothetical protein BJX76DRAFT_356719 [Aspergillus varians]